MASPDRVRVRHPGRGVTAVISREAFERRSRKLGWVLADDEQSAPRAETDQGLRLALLEEARRMGLTVHGNTKTYKLKEMIERAKAEL